jgi:Stathmin family
LTTLFALKAQRVEEVRKMSEQYSTELKERIERKMETTGEKRGAQLQSIQERIRDHVSKCIVSSRLVS